jgi:hypothetical protein
MFARNGVGRAALRVSLSVGLALAMFGCGSKPTTRHASTSTSRPARSTTTAAPSSSVVPAPTTSTIKSTTIASSSLAARYVPLFPFTNLQEVADWQQNYGRDHQHWRLDAGQTALAFAHFLGYAGIDRVVAVSSDTKGAHVAVGFATEGGQRGTAALVHLIRYGSGENVPWEVVGTDDTTFALESPTYGATVRSPVRVGGHITGVDESIAVHIQQLHANGFLGERCCVAAGGLNSPWNVPVSFGPPTDPVLIISASTGGHLRPVERFAVTAVRYG